MKKSCLCLTLALCFVLAVAVAGCGSTTTTTAAVSETTTSVAIATTAAVTTTTAAPTTTTTEASGAWTDLSPAGDLPAARAGHSMVYDENSGKVILFGGWDKTDFGDTWAYDPAANTWTELKPAGDVPSPRHDLAMAYDAGSGKVILFGGVDATTYQELGDTWAYDPAANTWTNLNPAGDVPKARCLHCMAYDSTAKKVILFGGSYHGGPLGDTWAYDSAANTWTEVSSAGAFVQVGEKPVARYGSRMVYDPDLGKVLLFGGSDGHLLGDTWTYDPAANTWTDVVPVTSTADKPAAREYHAMAYDPEGHRAVLFGGCGIAALNDTWAYDSAANAWTKLSPAGDVPSARTYSALVYAASSGKFILFGGSEDVAPSKPVGDTWSHGPAS